MDWTPVILPCHAKDCHPPPNIYEFAARNPFQVSENSIGVKRLYVVSNDHLDRLIKHETPQPCTRDCQKYWTLSRDGPIPFLICGGLLNESNKVDMHYYQKYVLNQTEYRDSHSFVTYSPNDSLCTFNTAQVKLKLTLKNLPSWMLTNQMFYAFHFGLVLQDVFHQKAYRKLELKILLNTSTG